MRYYSDTLDKLFGTPEALEKAENEAKMKAEAAKKEKEALAATRKSRADEVEAARKKVTEAQKEYRNLIDKFCKDYGSYHYTSFSWEDFPKFFDLF